MSEEQLFTWIDSYMKIANALRGMQDQEGLLLEIAGRHCDLGGAKRIDPFTFMATYNRQTRWETKTTILSDIFDSLHIEASLPEGFAGIPVVNNLKWRFFDGTGSAIDEMWRLFITALDYADAPTDDNRSQFINLFDEALKQKNVGAAKLTSGLYWARPSVFLPVDRFTLGYLKAGRSLAVPGAFNGATYLDFLKMVASRCDDSAFEISAKAYEFDGWGPLSEAFDPNISTDQWRSCLEDSTVFNDVSLRLVLCMDKLGGSATCKELAERFGETPSHYIGVGTNLGKRIAEHFSLEPEKRDNGDNKYWSIPFLGKDVKDSKRGSFEWKLRPELSEALSLAAISADVDAARAPLSDQYISDLNGLIDGAGACNGWWLTASPKVWQYGDIEVGDDQFYTRYNEKGNPRRIQSNFAAAKTGDIVFGYEASPVKAVVALCEISQDPDDRTMHFKKMRDLSKPILLDDIKKNELLSDCEFLRNPNGSFFKLTPNEVQALLDMIDDHDESSPISQFYPAYTDDDFLCDVFVSAEDLKDLKGLLRFKKNVILQGAPGTGKTYAAKRLAWAMMGNQNNSHIEMVQFHQNTTYDELVVGYRPNADGGFALEDGPFVRFCEKAAADPDPNSEYFFIIDEINRANISKVFGELLMLIEADHRGDKVRLSAGGHLFSVPKNVLIVGMMNTADRGLALIDYALRRRFAFFEMTPSLDGKSAAFNQMIEACPDKRMSKLVAAVRDLNVKIKNDPTLGDGFCIGHSYFCHNEADCVESIVKYELIPLVREYWFDDKKKVEEAEKILRGVL